ncbi:MAG: hypothetical protein K6D59_07955 [Bacteroidales bacterium]|nr:hypothetical protein [Bacteroidales bacterium]
MKSTSLISSALLTLLLCTAFSLSGDSWRAPRFGDMYDCYIICDAEVSPYSDEDYEQVDSDELMDILSTGRYSHTAFVPQWRILLYDDEGVRYRLYTGASCRHFRIDGNYFKLNRKQTKKLKRLLGS